jgi:hypothetical protein
VSLINTYDQQVAAGGDRIVIYYRIQETGRASQNAAWQVGRFKDGQKWTTDSKAAWYDYNHKTFNLWRNAGESLKDCRARKLNEAINWVSEKYGPREFVKNQVGDYVEKEVNEKFPLPKREKP